MATQKSNVQTDRIKQCLHKLMDTCKVKRRFNIVSSHSVGAMHVRLFYEGNNTCSRFTLVYNPEFTRSLDDESLYAVVAHEYAHTYEDYTTAQLPFFLKRQGARGLVAGTIGSLAAVTVMGTTGNRTLTIPVYMVSNALNIASGALTVTANALNRKREQNADRLVATWTSPEALVTGLIRMEEHSGSSFRLSPAENILFATHPPTSQRIAALQKMAEQQQR